jgi:dienelactone hydrolase
VRRLGVALSVVVAALAVADAASASVLVVGDSLVVGTAPYLRQQLSESVVADGRIGRPSPEAVSVLRSRFSGQGTVIFDAGVNDDPAQPSRLSTDLGAARSITGDRCLVVATMSRPPYRGVSIDGLNRAVRSFVASSSNVELVDWRAAAVANPRLINSDGVHPTSAGYRLRATLFLRAIAACGTAGGPPSSGGLPPAGTPPPANLKPPPSRPRKRPSRPRRRPPRPAAPAPQLGDQSPVLLDLPVKFSGLSGELIAPAGSGRHPAVVMLQGSGRATREAYREQAEFLAERGVAALIYDKRPDYSYARLADDGRAAVAMLRGRPEVRPDAVGLWGFGEGGSIAPMVAAANPSVAAVMVVSASGLPPASSREWAVRRSLAVDGAGAGVGAVSRWYSVTSSGPDSGDLTLDPALFWRRVAQPVLAVWSGPDPVVPAHESAVALRDALAAGRVNRTRVFRVFPAATHSLGVPAEGGRPGSAPGFKELSASWLRDHLGRPATAPLVSTPLPPAGDVAAQPVQEASLLERWPVQLAWLVLPALAALALGWRVRASSHRWWLAAAAVLDLLAVGALVVAVTSIVADRGRGVSTVAGVPVVILVAWLVALAGAGATALLVRRARRDRSRPALGVALAGSAWLLLVLYWLV